MSSILFFILFAAIANYMADACITIPLYFFDFQTNEIYMPSKNGLGMYQSSKLDNSKILPFETCRRSTLNSTYLEINNSSTTFEAWKMSAIFMHLNEINKGAIFIGGEATEEALKRNCTQNILLSDLDLPHYHLIRNNTNGNIFEIIEWRMVVYLKIIHDKSWNNVTVLDCVDYRYHVALKYQQNNVTFTMINDFESQGELAFISLARIGGFYKQECIQ